jgi:predicted amidohydrolase
MGSERRTPSRRIRELRVAAVSPQITLGDVNGNVCRVGDSVRAAVEVGAKLVVAPELALCGYAFDDRREAEAAALTRGAQEWGAITSALPAGCVAVVGYAQKDGDYLFNTAAVLTADGYIGDYRKAHLWGRESALFDTGDEAGTIVETPIGRLGVAICYDNEFPEVPRRLALSGAELLALPVNWPYVARPVGEHPPEVIQAMAAARSSRLATVVADRTGRERGIEWTGGSCVITDDGWVTARGSDAVIAATLSLRPPSDKSLPPHNDLFNDRRPNLY